MSFQWLVLVHLLLKTGKRTSDVSIWEMEVRPEHRVPEFLRKVLFGARRNAASENQRNYDDSNLFHS